MNPAEMIAQQVPPAAPKPPQPEKPGYSGVELTMPDDFAPPAGLKPDQEFQALATLKIKGDSTLCLTAIDGSAVETKKQEAAEPKPDSEKPAGEVIQKGLAEMGMPA